jgi:hypothetical protein
MNETAEILEHGLSSAFWKLFCEHVNTEWGGIGRRFEGAINDLANQHEDDAVLVSKMRQIAVARREILKLLQWPQEEFKRQTASDVTVEDIISGRAPLNNELVSFGRRGGL